MTTAKPFSISTLQYLSNDTKNTLMQGVLGPAVKLWTFGSPGGLPNPCFFQVLGFTPTLGQSRVVTVCLLCIIYNLELIYMFFEFKHCKSYNFKLKLSPPKPTSKYLTIYSTWQQTFSGSKHYSYHICYPKSNLH